MIEVPIAAELKAEDSSLKSSNRVRRLRKAPFISEK